MKTKPVALVLLGTLALPAAAADINGYRFFSGGAAMDRDGWISSLVDQGAKELKPQSLGGYIHGSYDFDNQIFIEASARYLKNRQLGFFAGVGYYSPCDENASFYLLGGISGSGQLVSFKITNKTEEPKTIPGPIQVGNGKLIVNNVEMPFSKTITVTDTTETEKETNAKVGLAPRVELGYKVALNERLGMRVALQSSYGELSTKVKSTVKTNSRSTGEVSILSKAQSSSDKQVTLGLALSGQYALTEQLALEAGYNWSCSSPTEKLKLQSKQGVHREQLGLRYLF